MIGSFLTRGLLLIFGYAYPGYECYKTVELNKPNIDQLQFWCQYWILVAGLTICERIGDTFIGWLPMYGEAKLAFFIYLWFPKTKGTTYVYSSFFRPYVAKHETEIDRNLLELRTRAVDMAVLYWQKATSTLHTRIFDILQYIASQSTPPRPPRQPHQQEGSRVKNQNPPGVATNRVPVNAMEEEQASSPGASTTCSSEKQEETEEEDDEEETEFSGDSKATSGPAPKTVNEEKTTTAQFLLESSKSSESNEEKVKVKKIELVKENNRPPLKDVVLHQGTRMGLRRTRRGQVNNRLKE